MVALGYGSISWRRFWLRSRALGLSVVALALGLVGCTDAPEPELPEPPDGAELVLEVGELEVYKAFDGELCAGTLRRIELHANGLAELFDMDPPRARVFIYDEIAAVDAVCSRSEPVWGCAPSWGAHALSISVTHELVHVFVNAATGVLTRPAIQEGVAWALQGDWDVPGDSPQTYEELETMLAMRSPFGLAEVGDAHFFAWAIDRFGAQAVLDAHVATAHASSDDEVESALAQSLGFDSLADLYAEYEATRAIKYPPLMDVARVVSSEELEAGTLIDTSCAGVYTEGPTDDETVVRVLLNVPQTGEYALTFSPLFTLPFCPPPRWRPSEPVVDWPDDDVRQAEMCPFDQDPRHAVFRLAGHYEITLDDADLGGCDMLRPPEQLPLSNRYLNGGDVCTYP